MARKSTVLAEPATERQVAYAATLRTRVSDFTPLDISQREIGDRLWGPEAGGPVSKEEASYLISGLLRCPAVDSDRGETVPVGFYWHDDKAYSVVQSGNGTHYAKQLVRIGKDRKSDFWRYARGVIYDLAPTEKVTLAQAVKRFHNISPR